MLYRLHKLDNQKLTYFFEKLNQKQYILDTTTFKRGKNLKPYIIFVLLMPFTLEKTEEIEAHLAKNPYLSEGGLPGAVDAEIYFALNGAVPDVDKTPNFHHWYYFLNSFSNDLMKTWVSKTEKKPAAEEDDLFGDDDNSTPAPAPKPKVEPKKKKEKPVAKSIVVFDVKVYDTETDLDVLAKKILERQIDGLVWSTDIKKLEVAFGIFKLQLGCVIEDDKVLTDDIFEPIEEWEEVQSVDMISMQKL